MLAATFRGRYRPPVHEHTTGTPTVRKSAASPGATLRAPGSAGDPVRLGLHKYGNRKLVLGILLLLAIGVILLIAAARSTSTGRMVAFALIGGIHVFIAGPGSVPLIKKSFLPDVTLVVDTERIRHQDSAVVLWSVQWTELTRVAITRRVHREVRQGNMLGRGPSTVEVGMELVPRDGGFLERHAEMGNLQQPDAGGAYHVAIDECLKPTGAAKRRVIKPLDEALRGFACGIYGGVVQQGAWRAAW